MIGNTRIAIKHFPINIKDKKFVIKNYKVKSVFKASILQNNFRKREFPKVYKKNAKRPTYLLKRTRISPKYLLTARRAKTNNTYASCAKLSFFDSRVVSFTLQKKSLLLMRYFYSQNLTSMDLSTNLEEKDVDRSNWNLISNILFDYSIFVLNPSFRFFKNFYYIYNVCRQMPDTFCKNQTRSFLKKAQELNLRYINKTTPHQFFLQDAQDFLSTNVATNALLTKTLLWHKTAVKYTTQSSSYKRSIETKSSVFFGYYNDQFDTNNYLIRKLLWLNMRIYVARCSSKNWRLLRTLGLSSVYGNGNLKVIKLKATKIYGANSALARSRYYWAKNNKIIQSRYRKILMIVDKYIAKPAKNLAVTSNLSSDFFNYPTHRNQFFSEHTENTTPVSVILNKWSNVRSFKNVQHLNQPKQLFTLNAIIPFTFSLLRKATFAPSNFKRLESLIQIRSISAYSTRPRIPAFITKRYDLKPHDFGVIIGHKDTQTTSLSPTIPTKEKTDFSIKTSIKCLPKTMHISNIRYWASIFLFKHHFQDLFLGLTNIESINTSSITNPKLSGFPLQRSKIFHNTNVYPNFPVVRISTKKVIKIMFDSIENVESTVIYTARLTRFIQNITGKATFIKLQFGDSGLITMVEFVRFLVWAKRILFFKKSVSTVLHIEDSLQIIWVSLKTHDTSLLMYWIKNIMLRITSWKHRNFFSYIKYVLATFITPLLKTLNVTGVQLLLKGKISVAGNARTRKISLKAGNASFTTLAQRVSYSHSTVSTFTGVLGVHIWFFYV